MARTCHLPSAAEQGRMEVSQRPQGFFSTAARFA
jgi:hypothetical protein